MSYNIVEGGTLKKVAGSEGTYITKVEQTTSSTIAGGKNVLTVSLSNGQATNFEVLNGLPLIPTSRPETLVNGMIWIEY